MPKKHALIAGRINCTCIFYFLHLFCYSTWKCWPAYKASRENPTHSPTPCEILHFSTGDWGPKLAYTKRNPYIFTFVPFWSFSVTTSPKFLRVGFRCCVYSAASSVVKCNGSALSGGTVELDQISQFALQFYVCFTDEIKSWSCIFVGILVTRGTSDSGRTVRATKISFDRWDVKTRSANETMGAVKCHRDPHWAELLLYKIAWSKTHCEDGSELRKFEIG